MCHLDSILLFEKHLSLCPKSPLFRTAMATTSWCFLVFFSCKTFSGRFLSSEQKIILCSKASNWQVFLDIGVLNLRSSHTRAYLYLEPSFCRVFQGDTFVTENPSSLLLRFQKFVTDATPLWKMIETRGQSVYFPQTKSEIEPRLSISNLVKARHRFDPLVGYSWNASERERR